MRRVKIPFVTNVVLCLQELFIKDLTRQVYSSKDSELSHLEYGDLSRFINSREQYKGFLEGLHFIYTCIFFVLHSDIVYVTVTQTAYRAREMKYPITN